jgi:hypothetical protein
MIEGRRAMKTLNDPTGSDSSPEEEWTPETGLRRAIQSGIVAAMVLSAVLAPIAYAVPMLLIPWYLRGVWAFGVAWILFGVVQRAAGMVGRQVRAIAIALTLVVLLSNHLIFALYGVPAGMPRSSWLFPAVLVEDFVPVYQGVMRGFAWFHPAVLALLNAAPLVGIGFATAFRHDGG